MKKSLFKMRSGNSPLFKHMGSSPAKELSGMFQDVADAEHAVTDLDALTDPIEEAIKDTEETEEEKEERILELERKLLEKKEIEEEEISEE